MDTKSAASMDSGSAFTDDAEKSSLTAGEVGNSNEERHDATTKQEQHMVILVSKDGQEFPLPVSAALLCEIVRNALGDDVDDQDEDNNANAALSPQRVDIANVMGSCLKEVVEFLLHHEQEKLDDIILPLLGRNFNENMEQEWYRNFIGTMDLDMVYQILGAANYMNIKPLLDLACLRVTFELSNRSAEEIQDLLDLPKHLTPEEQAREYQEYAWIFDEKNHDRQNQEEENNSS